jgi:hypothetical protein
MEEFGVDEQGRLNLFGAPDVSSDDPPDSSWDEQVPAGWDPPDEDDAARYPDEDDDAWLRSMPADLRAEVLARPPLPVLSADERANAGLWEVVGGTASFAYGAFCDTMLPGSLLGDMLATATKSNVEQLSDDVLTGLLRGWQRQVSHCQSSQAHLVAELARRRLAESGRPGSSTIAEHVVDELQVELTLTSWAARRLADVASGLDRLPFVDEALLNGLIDWPRACLLVDELAVLDDATAQQIAEQLTEQAVGWTTGQLRAALARAVLAADPQAAERRKKRARQDARVDLWREDSGNAALAGRELRPANAIALARKLDSDADWLSACGVPGTKGELRALAFTTLLSGRELTAILDDPCSWPQTGQDAADEATTSGEPTQDGTSPGSAVRDGRVSESTKRDAAGLSPDEPTRTGGAADHQPNDRARRDIAGDQSRAGSIHLTMPLATWLGGDEPGDVAGYGPADGLTSRELGRLLSRDPATRWCLTLTGADGRAVAHACARRGPPADEPVITWAASLRTRMQVLECGPCSHAHQSTGYVPPARLRHLVVTRQRRCSFPGCRRSAVRCDLDHTVPFHHGGLTCECNLAPLCRRHHRAKQTPGWHLTQSQPGIMTWQLPSGRKYQTTGERYPV